MDQPQDHETTAPVIPTKPNNQTTTFASLGLTKPSLEAIAQLGFDTPTPIQEAVIPEALAQHDILAAAQTGTGKTLAFLLPIFDLMVRHWGSKRPKRAKGPYVLILAPTRELASQIASQARIIGQTTQFRVQSVMGGKNIKHKLKPSSADAMCLLQHPDVSKIFSIKRFAHLLTSII